MIEALFKSEQYQLARQFLDAAVLRHQAIASNIANAETPGYRRVDLAPNFAAQLQRAMEHGELGTAAAPRPTVVEDFSARAIRPDGNNVEVEKELLELSRNNSEHMFLTQLVSSNLRGLRVAITGRNT